MKGPGLRSGALIERGTVPLWLFSFIYHRRTVLEEDKEQMEVTLLAPGGLNGESVDTGDQTQYLPAGSPNTTNPPPSLSGPLILQGLVRR